MLYILPGRGYPDKGYFRTCNWLAEQNSTRKDSLPHDHRNLDSYSMPVEPSAYVKALPCNRLTSLCSFLLRLTRYCLIAGRRTLIVFVILLRSFLPRCLPLLSITRVFFHCFQAYFKILCHDSRWGGLHRYGAVPVLYGLEALYVCCSKGGHCS